MHPLDLWEGPGLGEAIAVLAEHRQQQGARDGEQLADPGIGEAVEDMAAATLGDHEVVPAQHGQVLGEVGGLELGPGLEGGDRQLRGVREQLEQTDADRVSEALEEVRLDLVEGTLRLG